MGTKANTSKAPDPKSGRSKRRIKRTGSINSLSRVQRRSQNRLNARIRGYNDSLARVSLKESITKPGSNKAH